MTKFLFKRDGVSVYYHSDEGTYSVKLPNRLDKPIHRVPLSELPYHLQADAQDAASKYIPTSMSLYTLLG